jgi:c-di-AMP phosphodiesterase-like protein
MKLQYYRQREDWIEKTILSQPHYYVSSASEIVTHLVFAQCNLI